ncbi:RNA polymerase subunit sigma [Thalassoglobus sp.]|uniref:RNA polymerase subunit sigma n=1 Tax=Thalassoglobus sp. TaxID=2795869 RepID=UPI003AA7E7FC
MSGPIVRTGATPEYWDNWDQVFGKKKKKAATKKKAAEKPAAEKPAKAQKKKPAKKKAKKK